MEMDIGQSPALGRVGPTRWCEPILAPLFGSSTLWFRVEDYLFRSNLILRTGTINIQTAAGQTLADVCRTVVISGNPPVPPRSPLG
ncbi:hypothetical protein J6590_075117 [Homalodisca vitripennis]|nr:hypothetical protein J6590_075117 [Homalodisca vitripennis]